MLSGLRVIIGLAKARRLDPFAAYLLLTFGLSLAVGLSTTDPKLVLIGNTVVNGVGGLLFLGSCWVGTPLTQVVSDRFRPTEANESVMEARHRRRIHLLLSATWGIGLLLEVAVRLAVIEAFSVDTANGVNSVITLAVIALLVLATAVTARRTAAPRQGEGDRGSDEVVHTT
ncbi:hypothetical protein B1R94_07050 [Mycolicibacterium litorale]|nr:hypothetical protein B1R94_07050 [Mycolicibacterium litorale]